MDEPVSKRPKRWPMKARALPRQPFLGLALAAGIGIILAEFFPVSPAAWPLLGLVFLCAAVAACRWPRLTATYALVGFALFLLHILRTADTPGKRLAAALGERARPVTAVGAVVSEPKVAPNQFATFLFKLERLEFEGTQHPTHAKLFVRWRGNPAVGDKLHLFGTAEPLKPPRNPGEFNMRAYLMRQGVWRALFVRYPEDGVLVHKAAGNPVLRAARKSRAWMEKALCRGLEDSPDVQTFVTGVTIGLHERTAEEIEEPFQQTGTLHLFAVSGLNVAIVARLLWIFSMIARLPRRWATALVIPALFFYATVTGLEVPSVRAAVMTSILLGGFFVERKVFAVNSLAAAAFFLFAWNTNELFATGFQLSFLVVAAIILLADPIFVWLKRATAPDVFLPPALLRWPRSWMRVAMEWLARGLSVSLAAFIGSLPLILWYFYLFTPISLLANLLIVPIAFFVLAIALLSILAATFVPWLSIIFNNANWCLSRVVIGLVQFFAHVPGSHFYVEHPRWPDRSVARITVLDAGAGAAVHLRARRGEWLLDCGNERDYERLLHPYLHAAGVNRVDGLILSHGDSLHIGGAAALLGDFPRLRLIDNAAPDRSSVHQRLRHLFEQHRIRVEGSVAGRSLEFSHDVNARILYPPAAFVSRSSDDQALVTQVSVRQSAKILFLSDSGYATENALLASGENLRSDILVKGQHHSGNSGSDTFLDAVQPKLIVSTSRDFPEAERISDEWAGRVRRRGIKLFRQDETGAVEVRFREQNWEARAYLTGEIFRSDNR